RPAHDHADVSSYLSDEGTLGYLANIGLYLKLYLPGVFEHRRLGGAVNGSPWSLFPEVLCYLTVPLIGLLSRQCRLATLGLLAIACGGVSQYMFFRFLQVPEVTFFYGADVKYLLAQVPFFMAGACFRVLEERFADLYRTDIALICCIANYT